MSKKKLSVIIVTYNSEKLIKKCLDSIFQNNDINEGLEVIIVDNKSSKIEELEQILNENFSKKITFIKNDKNGGYGQGNNLGINICNAPYVMIINPDVVLYKPIFKNQIEIFESNIKIGIIGLQQFENDEFLKNDSFIVNMPYIKNLFLHKIYKKFNIFNYHFFCFSGACFFLRKSSFIEAGKFDERIFLYGEEADLQYRIRSRAFANQIYFNKNYGYIHPTHDRQLEVESHIQGFKSFIILGESQKISSQKMKIDILRYYKFLSIYFKSKDREMANFYRELLPKLEEEYKILNNKNETL